MRVLETQLGGLTCRILDDTKNLKGAVVLCHGYGAPGTDLVGLAPEVMRQHPDLAEQVRWVFPEAPLDLGAMAFGGRAWWNLDVNRIMDARTEEDLLAIMTTEPDGLKHARRLLRAALDELQAQTGLAMNQIVLGGFSQGAMLATDVALHLEDAPAGLCVFSGALVAREIWERKAKSRTGLSVVQTHGRQDAILPFVVGEHLHRMLSEAGLEVNFQPFNGPHTISGEGLDLLATLVRTQLKIGPAAG